MDYGYHQKVWEVIADYCGTLLYGMVYGTVLAFVGVAFHGKIILFCVVLPTFLCGVALWYASEKAHDMLSYIEHHVEEEQQTST